ncbi:40S ribosomal protein S30 [Dictyostelium discoideum AX4]|uniref:Small ribosomal subunit protein eS30 n=2 Tax=Dictyostelium TaxID=5782 RepID=RS30_DICDI|nr:40S ribosomal protein S30 [Dictyostelium discoideum AX4]XP_644762.1 40S ribosomal protein S30 [Dictyostelium discoideum AX4]Q556Y1.1 RecName: Full=Small ribosomal subunit protein eS30; AltName: Full=40S ribosomal protein S30 [Dictyostelium discoideum]EAL70562.1 40S ribosomal protein S30 [Dictyostelium discoideum AX4]EAL70813.1 40S ribosomal protein S30 [Dictyostelium discoideum AX4]|eukprot:XP_644488.1 40S ribosomal protein S30 [Dictyostelium discoideum AX4]
MGKVHGGLNRAGKVRNATPKKDKEEKRKPKVGRAKKRMIFNRRNVAAVAGFGKKKGYNTQNVPTVA